MLPGARTIYSWREGASMGTTLTIGSRRNVKWHLKDAAKAKAKARSDVRVILKVYPQMCANTGIATDSARVSRSAR